MPGGNGTGPMGMGPMTGRGAGYCSGMGAPGYAAGGGVGGGFGRGGGLGRRNRCFATAPWGGFARPASIDPDAERQILKNQADALRAQLDAIQKRLDEMA